MSRKTIDREVLIERANKFLAQSPNELSSDRITVHMMVADILLESNSYKGYQYLATAAKPGLSIGIIFDESEERNHVYPDKTRIKFF